MIETPLRPRIDLSRDWRFLRKKVGRRWLAGRGEDGGEVSLPHCWNALDTFQYGRSSYSGWGSYRRTIEIPAIAAGGQWHLFSGGFYGVGDVWFNGTRIAEFDGQYLGFRIGMEPDFPDGSHDLGIRLDNRWRRNVLPGFRQPDFILHGGLAGRVRLERRPVVHFDLSRTHVVCEKQPTGHELVSLQFSLLSHSSVETHSTVEWAIVREDGDPAGRSKPLEVKLEQGVTKQSSAHVVLEEPQTWSPDQPNLYWAEGRLTAKGKVLDVVRIRFGITRAEFRPQQGFFLDGERVDLHGCNRHEAIPGLGNALPDELQRRDARILKDLGCNFVRLSHYPQSPVFLDACDELGLLVYPEIATWKSVRSSKGWRRAARRQMTDLIVRDRHHPSIVVWGMGNESRSRKAYSELGAIARDLDPNRPVTYAENHLHRARRGKTVGIPDVWSVNYELDVLEEARDSSRLENVILSECCNHPRSIRGNDEEELAQLAALERDWTLMADRPYLAGHTVWCFTDYATEHRDRYRRLPGLFDAWRQPKMAAELFRARYSARPFVSVFITELPFDAPPSSFRKEHSPLITGGGLFLHVFSNCDSVRLSQNGAFLALLEGAPHHVVEIDARCTEVIATGSRSGKMVQASYRDHGEAARIEVTAPSEPFEPGRAIELDISVRDRAGLPVRDWNGIVQLQIEGPGRLHCFSEDNVVEVARGLGRAYFTLDEECDAVAFTASAEGLSPGILSIELQ